MVALELSTWLIRVRFVVTKDTITRLLTGKVHVHYWLKVPTILTSCTYLHHMAGWWWLPDVFLILCHQDKSKNIKGVPQLPTFTVHKLGYCSLCKKPLKEFLCSLILGILCQIYPDNGICLYKRHCIQQYDMLYWCKATFGLYLGYLKTTQKLLKG